MLNSKNQLKIGAVLSYLSIALSIVSGLIYTPWMIEKIGQSEYGLYTLAYSLITLFLVDFGLSSATARYLSNYHAQGDQTRVNNFLGMIYKLYILIDAVIMIALIVVYFLIDTIYVKLTPEELRQFKVVYVIAASFSIINFPFVTLNGILTAYEKFVQLKLADVIYRVLVFLLMVAALLAGYGLYALVTVNAAAGLAIIVYKLAVIRKNTPVKVNFRYSERSLYKDIFGFSFWTTLASLFQRLIFNITPSILGFVSNSAAIAVFGVVTTIEGHFYTLSSAVNGMFMPRISRIYTGPEAEKNIYPLMVKVGKFQYALNGLIVAGFAVIGQEFIDLWMGEAFRDAYWGILLVIIPGLFFNSLQIANTAIVVTKHVKYNALVNLVMGLINITLSVQLSGKYGVIGSCISIFAAYLVRNVALNVLYHKKLRINMVQFARDCYLRLSFPIILTVILGLWINAFLPFTGWGGLIVKAGCIILIYSIALLLFGTRSSPGAALRQAASFLKK